MVKHFRTQLRRQQVNQPQKIEQKINQLKAIRANDLKKDCNRVLKVEGCTHTKASLKEAHTLSADVDEMLKDGADETAQEVHCYKVALRAATSVLAKMQVANQRPHDYLVQMYKSDKQMLRVRGRLTRIENQMKEKMQGKGWLSKNKRKEKAMKKAEVKRENKKIKKASMLKVKMHKINGKRMQK